MPGYVWVAVCTQAAGAQCSSEGLGRLFIAAQLAGGAINREGGG